MYRLCFRRISRTAPNVDVIEARSLLVSFGLMFLVQNLAYLAWGADLRGYSFLDEPVEIGGARFTANRLVALLGGEGGRGGHQQRAGEGQCRQAAQLCESPRENAGHQAFSIGLARAPAR